MPTRPSLVLFLLALVGLQSGCTVGPLYKRPPVEIPVAYRGDVMEATRASLGEARWWEVFQDQELQKLIVRALMKRRMTGV